MLPILVSATGVWGYPAPEAEVDYPHGEFRDTCELCHTANAWQPARISKEFDHSKYGFVLDGAHATADCLFCHKTLEFEKADSDCAACHQDVHQGEFGTDCAACHGTRSFVDRSEQVAMHRETRFPLTGAHATLDCAQCHSASGGNASFVNTSTECYACHADQYAATQTPNHVTAGFSTDCSECHGMVSWSGGDFNGSHDFFPLRGGHANVECASCHTSGQFAAVDPRCVACHQAEFDGTVEPVHSDAGFSTECEVCHTIDAWEGAVFDHDTTDFPLTGAHIATDCAQCHVSGRYDATSTDCYACHSTEFADTTDPGHVAASFPHECEVCHNTSTWDGASFDHNSTGFALTGAHMAVDCAQCHVGGQYTGTNSDCYACHQADYAGTTDPDHAGSGFGTDCEFCHTTATWEGANFDHSLTAFPLTGAHLAVECTQCHVGGQYTGTNRECYACHQTDFASTADPSHSSAGFAHTCEECHGTIVWTGGNFDHATTSFLLTGAHLSASCVECHVGEVYAGIQGGCYDCHRDDYDGTTNPAHAGAGFGTQCDSCHGTSTWLGASFDHDADFFPIYAGSKHAGKWDDCSDCHTNPGNYAVFDCLNCHPHSDKRETDDKHRGETNDYIYESNACYDCHPRGRG